MNNFKNNDEEMYRLEDELKETLAQYVVKTPSNEDTNKLLSSLQMEFSKLQQQEEVPAEAFKLQKPTLLSQMKNQLSFYQWHFWIVSLGIFTMLTLYTASATPRNPETFFLFVIPLSIIIGIFYTFQSWNKEIRLVESITPFPPALLLMTRMLIILFMNLLFGVVSSVIVGASVSIYMLPFLLYWIAPAILTFGAFAYVTMKKGVLFGLGAAGVTWLAIFIADVFLQENYLWREESTITMNHMAIYQLILLFIGIVLSIRALRKSLFATDFQV
ncbi:hypothetical protein [Bacillus alkalisoli]|uniref:hypothetical protein n=1 Tax=Bacillus alkalisoli TaxID=2011008 RepID=UPI000C23C94C|nr:hypothetical protein [Bacillus alkalisoli]